MLHILTLRPGPILEAMRVLAVRDDPGLTRNRRCAIRSGCTGEILSEVHLRRNYRASVSDRGSNQKGNDCHEPSAQDKQILTWDQLTAILIEANRRDQIPLLLEVTDALRPGEFSLCVGVLRRRQHDGDY
jgi:hypothetical protein